MQIKCAFVSALPDPEAFQELMEEYYAIMLDKLVAAGGPLKSPKDLARDTIAHMDDLMPPDGRTLLATDEHGRLMGCGVIRKIRPNAAELKRIYVRPEARGTGLGRKLFEMRMQEARKMDCTRLFADTVKDNRAMLAMYESMGFSYIPRYPENANPIEMEPFLVYLKLVFPDENPDT